MVVIGVAARDGLVGRLADERATGVAAAFATAAAHGGTIDLRRRDKAELGELLAVLNAWLNDVGRPALPPGVTDLRKALARELGDAR